MRGVLVSRDKSVHKWRRRLEELCWLLMLLFPAVFYFFASDLQLRNGWKDRHVFILLVLVLVGLLVWLLWRPNFDKAFRRIYVGIPIPPFEMREIGHRVGDKLYELLSKLVWSHQQPPGSRRTREMQERAAKARMEEEIAKVGAKMKEAAAAPIEEPEPPRYTDLTIYEGHLFSSEDLKGASRLPDGMPLVIGRPYTLEVAIRLKRTGIEAEKEPRRPVENPRQDKENLTIYVLARPQWPGIEIKESFRDITWPYNQDSESALFRLDVKPVSFGYMPSGFIEVRVFDGKLDLLDIVQVLVAIVAEESEQPVSVSRYLVWPDKKPGVPLINLNSPLRRLSIDVSFDIGSLTYNFLFKFLPKSSEEVQIPGSSTITGGDIENLLVKIRNFWTELVITNYATALSVSAPTFAKYLARLRDLGVEAWTLLFGDGYAAQAGASETIGKLLAGLQLDQGAHIQIVHGNLRDFIFPWSILYPPTGDQGAVDTLQFLGVRYRIEQVTDGPERYGLEDVPVGVIFALDSGFGNAESQKELLEDYQAAAGGKLVVTKPISDQTTLFAELIRDPSAHLLYFYCHGYAPAGPGIRRRDGVQVLKESIEKLIEKLPEDSPDRKALETLLTLTGKMDDEAWIFIGGAEIQESKIKLQKFFAPKRRPIVFLNMCQSAELMPSMSSGLVRVFLRHNASAVVGTESPMTAVFAHEFAKVVFDALFRGDDIGTALWKARRHFLTGNMRNPLGLAYTLYGRAVARLGTGAIISPAAGSNTNPAITNA